MTLALAIIAKDEVEQIKRILTCYEPYFHEIAIAYDDDIIAKEITATDKVKLYKYEWRDDFGHKRNWLAERIKSDYYFRLDTDDVIDKPELILQSFAKYVQKGNTVVFCNYQYGFDDSGNCNAQHWRETIIKNDGNIFWNKPIHENINPKSFKRMNAVKEHGFSIIHKKTKEELEASTERNLKILLKEIVERDKDGKKQDPRTIGYVARMFLGIKEYEKSIPFFEQFLATSGWDDDKYFAWIQLSDCYIALGDLNKALNCVNEALLMNPSYPNAYSHLMSVYFEMGEYQKAIIWGKQCFDKKTPDTMIPIDPSEYTWRPMAQLAMCYAQTGEFDKCLTLLRKAQEIAPNDKKLKESFDRFVDIYIDNDMIKNYLKLMKYTASDLKKFNSLIDSIPRQLASDERILTAKNMIIPPKVWDDKSVVFFCGGAWEDWIDTSVIGGIGGSEEATIYLSREFTKLGYKVTIYNQCGELAGTYNGVEYKSHFDFNSRDKFNILISWRQNVKAKAKKKYIWLHDVPFKDQFLPEDLEDITKILVLSNYHRSLLPEVPDDKIYITRNGINLKDFEGLEGVERNTKRCIWTSSYDRGLEQFLPLWQIVLNEVPDAELHLFYGWNTYKEMEKQGRRSPEWRIKMQKLMEQKNVYEHGRVGHKKLAKELAKSGIFAYPTSFEEISCISAMKAQAAGAIPVVNNYAALKETVKYGIKVDGNVKATEVYDRYVENLVALLKDEERQKAIRDIMIPLAKESFGWEGLALEWAVDLFA